MNAAADDFWVITTYFNLTGTAVRLANYHCFRSNLSAPLLAVEWNPDGEFELKEGDADILMQLGGGDLMWQKERMMGIALESLPAHVKYVAWIDCDVLFRNARWKEDARKRLESCAVIQLFDEVAYADADESQRLIRTEGRDCATAETQNWPRRESYLAILDRLKDGIVAYDLDRRFQPDQTNSYNIMSRPAYGFAWAAPVAFLHEIGLYDRCIVGGGDLLFSYAVAGLSQQLIDNHKTAGWAFYGDCDSYRRWAARAADACAGRLGHIGGQIVHLFHGTLKERQYKSRIDGLVSFGLDLDRDIGAEPGQLWTWQRDRDALNAYFMTYLRGRNEDGAGGRGGPAARRRTGA